MKRIVVFLVSLILAFNMYCINIGRNSDIKQYDVNKIKVEKIICGYFNNQLENQKRLEVSDNFYIDPQSQLNKYNKLNSFLTIAWYKGIGEKVIWYDVKVKINSLEFIDDFIKVDVDNIVSLQYKNLNETSSYKERHIIYIKNKKRALLIQRDIYNEELLSNEQVRDIYLENEYEKYINKKIDIVNNRINTLDTDISRFNRKNNIICQGINNKKISEYRRYNGNKAAKWARENVNLPEDYEGQDCTNFVSKALLVGGIPTDYVWHKDSIAWVGVIELREWLLNNKYAIEYDYVNCDEGDIIQLYNSNYDIWSHSVIVTYANLRYASGYVYISAHTKAVNNVPLFKYYPTATYTKIRCLKIVY